MTYILISRNRKVLIHNFIKCTYFNDVVIKVIIMMTNSVKRDEACECCCILKQVLFNTTNVGYKCVRYPVHITEYRNVVL